ncbi:hypothetical protein QE152_g24642 [Popillia japonica]|uniref:Uncharacterized protein n=1 Tax=Popillia japonica TaxID=7064 RepID=A0AAW1K535_POPJA
MTVLLSEKEVLEYIQTKYEVTYYENEDDKSNAKKKDKKCKSYIVQCLGDDQIDIVRDKETAYDMWQSLEERYEKFAGDTFQGKKIVVVASLW